MIGKSNASVGGGGGGIPIVFSYTGSSQIAYDVEEVNGKKFMAFTLKLLTSGTLNIQENNTKHTDVYVVGGGGGGTSGSYSSIGSGGGGGAGAYLEKSLELKIQENKDYPIIVGAGGAGGVPSNYNRGVGTTGGSSSAFGITAAGGNAGQQSIGGGTGGSGGGVGYDNNIDPFTDSGYSHLLGKGDGKSKEILGKLYCGGGAGGGVTSLLYQGFQGGSNGSGTVNNRNGKGGAGGGGNANGGAGGANTGGGGAGGKSDSKYPSNGGAGGSGIVIIRGRYV